MKRFLKQKLIRIRCGLPLLIISVFILSMPGEQSFSQQLAFPGAEGYGKYATGGRGGAVYEVTNLNSSVQAALLLQLQHQENGLSCSGFQVQ